MKKSMNSMVLLSLLTLMGASLSHSEQTNYSSFLPHSQSLHDGQFLISPSQIFVLGFFTLGNSHNRYLGIWYNKLPGRPIVWVANRDAPLSTTSGTLKIRSGSLLLLDSPNGRAIWSTTSPMSRVRIMVITTAHLTDTGNFILTQGTSNSTLWQSFGLPTDTFLPGMTVPLKPKRIRDLFTSWKSKTDPSKGNFSMGPDPNATQMVIWRGEERWWRSGLWNGHTFIGVPNMAANHLYGFKLTDDNETTVFFNYTVYNSTDIIRFQVKWDGTAEQLRWDEGSKSWKVFWSQPTRPCDFYNTCGAFGSCNNADSPICTCLRGFEPRSKSEWNNRNWLDGCVRKAELKCDRNVSRGTVEGEEDWFHKLEGVKLPDFAHTRPSDSEDHCSQLCSNECSCKGYAYVTGIQCLTWTTDFIDVQRFGEGGQTLFIRLAASELGASAFIQAQLGKSKNKPKFVIILLLLGTLFLCTSAYIIWRCKTKAGRSVKETTKSREFWEEFSAQHNAEGNQTKGTELAMYSFKEIVTSTNNFSIDSKLGEGGFGPVYKGKLPCGQHVAVKRLSRVSGQGLEEFKNEIILIGKLQHRNLVRLVGCCIEGEEKVLLYEYLSNRSLDAFIFANAQEKLDWHQRYNIIEGIARGLVYLHRDSRLRIIHRDLKASNILLDEEMNPKISDFGMAKIFGGNQNQANTNRVVGTYGYMAPEYAMEGLFSVKSDVYSFGVLLLEIISGKKNNCRYPDYTTNHRIGYAWNLWGEERAMEFIDPCIRDTCCQASALRCINVGLLCVQDSAMDRPTMSTVVVMLEGETPILPTPRQPTFTTRRNQMEKELASTDSGEVVSNNIMTNTMVLGR